MIVAEPISRMKSLQVLHLERGEGLSDDGVKKILEGCKKNILIQSIPFCN